MPVAVLTCIALGNDNYGHQFLVLAHRFYAVHLLSHSTNNTLGDVKPPDEGVVLVAGHEKNRLRRGREAEPGEWEHRGKRVLEL